MLLCDIIVLAVIFVSGIGINLRVWIYIPFVWLIEYMLALGFALIISAGTVYFNDLEHITTVILMAWIYGTPIMYTIDQIPQSVRWIFQANPMTPIIEAYHHILYWGDTPSRYGLLYAFLFALIILLLGEITFMTLEENFAEEL
jgi:ABC-2 type transport system permease protein